MKKPIQTKYFFLTDNDIIYHRISKDTYIGISIVSSFMWPIFITKYYIEKKLKHTHEKSNY